ncbi:hypothetical protein [Deinococcus aquaticus]|uniref:hypothetical protein n=1 Tax=Deinococcus aquaticus TaxID=328692 RepID=UPI003620CD5F
MGDGVRLIRPVGRGSHSLVYFAVARDGQPCAVKIFPAHLSGYADREYQHAHDLHHPGWCGCCTAPSWTISRRWWAPWRAAR